MLQVNEKFGNGKEKNHKFVKPHGAVGRAGRRNLLPPSP